MAREKPATATTLRATTPAMANQRAAKWTGTRFICQDQ
jgi:hypothetical protein